jgi:hypothetical protein
MARAIEDGMTRRGDLRGDLLAEQASGLAVLGDARGARRLLGEANAHGAMPLNLALAWAALGNADRAFHFLECDAFLIYWTPQALWWDPRLDGIRDDPRFRGIRGRVERLWSPAWS